MTHIDVGPQESLRTQGVRPKIFQIVRDEDLLLDGEVQLMPARVMVVIMRTRTEGNTKKASTAGGKVGKISKKKSVVWPSSYVTLADIYVPLFHRDARKTDAEQNIYGTNTLHSWKEHG